MPHLWQLEGATPHDGEVHPSEITSRRLPTSRLRSYTETVLGIWSRCRLLAKRVVMTARRGTVLSIAVLITLGLLCGQSRADSGGPVVETGDAVRGQAALMETGSDERVGKLPYLCSGEVDYPHSSHTKGYTINVHFDTQCKMIAPNVSTEGSLSRSRWYGWELLKTSKGRRTNTRELRVVAPKGCKAGTKYRYKGQARFYVSGPQGKGSSHVYNQNDSEISCRGR